MIRLVFGILVFFVIFCFLMIELCSYYFLVYFGIEFFVLNCWKYKVVIIDFGGVGDGKIFNMKVFRMVLSKFSDLVSDGGV